MASISKISTQIVADARQFNSTVAASEKLAVSTFARIAKLQFNPGGDSGRPGPYKVRVDTGDSLKAVQELFARIKARADAARASVRGLFGRTRPVPYAPVQGAIAANALAVYKSLGSAAKVVGLTLGHAISHPGIGGAREFRDAWSDSFGKVVPSARTAYRALSVLTSPARGAVRAGAGLARGAVATGHEISREVSSFMPSPRMAALGMAAAVGVTAYGVKAKGFEIASAASNMRDFAVSAQISSQSVQHMELAFRALGVESGVAVEAMKTIEQLQVTSQIGGYGATDLMKRLGDDAERVLTVSGNVDDTMERVNASILSQNNAMRTAVLLSQVYGANAEKVLRYATMRQSIVLSGEMGNRNAGGVVPDDGVKLIQQTEMALTRLGMKFDQIVTKAVTAFAPVALSALNVAEKMLSGVNAEKMVDDIIGFLVRVASVVANLPTYFQMAGESISLVFQKLVAQSDLFLASLYRVQAVANGNLGDAVKSTAATAAAQDIENGQAAAREGIVATGKRLDELRGKLVDYKSVVAGMGVAAQMAFARQDTFDGYAQIKGVMRMYEQLISGAQQAARDVEQPFEKLQARLSQLDLMKGLGKSNMSPETYGRAVLKAFTEVESALGTTDIRLPTMGQRDSSEAVSAINRSEVEYRLKVADTPAVRQQRVLDQSLEVLQQIKAYAQASAEAATQRKTISLSGK